jgi:hypothetical protein
MLLDRALVLLDKRDRHHKHRQPSKSAFANLVQLEVIEKSLRNHDQPLYPRCISPLPLIQPLQQSPAHLNSFRSIRLRSAERSIELERSKGGGRSEFEEGDFGGEEDLRAWLRGG